MGLLSLSRFLLALLLWAGAVSGAQANVLNLGPQPVPVAVGASLQRVVMDPAARLDPDDLWSGAAGEPLPPSATWSLGSGKRFVGRVTLQVSGAGGVYVLTAPAATLDEIRIWHRESGGAWQSALAGDRIALSRWPFVAPTPAFPLLLGAAPVDLIVTAVNSGPLQLTLALSPDALYRAGQTRSASLSGVVMGLGAMVVVVCLLGALSLRRRSHWLLAGVALWCVITVVSFNGYLAVWLTSELPHFNDASKNFAGLVLSGLMVSLTVATLDPRYVGRPERLLAVLVPWLCVLWGAIQWLWLPPSWRMAGAVAAAAATVSCCVIFCVLNTVRGGRHVSLVAGAVACLAVVWAIAVVPREFASGLDLRSAAVGMLFYAALLLFRQALATRDRYGRDVLGRDAVRANRDPQTALLSHAGFQLAFEDALLRQAAGAGASSMMVFLLPGLKQSGAEHGFVVTERALVRFAAALQAALGPHWSIGRVSKARFACVSIHPQDLEQVGEQATKVLAQVARITHPLALLGTFDLRIACLNRRIESNALGSVLEALEAAALALPEGKRIAFA